MWDLIVSVPDHCLSFYFGNIRRISRSCCKGTCGAHARPEQVHRTKQITRPVWVPVWLSMDLLWAQNHGKPMFERCACTIFSNSLYGACTGPKFSKDHIFSQGSSGGATYDRGIKVFRYFGSQCNNALSMVARVGSPRMGSRPQ